MPNEVTGMRTKTTRGLKRKLYNIYVSCTINMKESEKINETLTEISSQISEIRTDIQLIVTPKFFNVSIQTNDLVEHAIELWRLENRLSKVLGNIPENQREIFTNSIKKLFRYLEKNDIEIVDYTNKKFNEGINLDILAVEQDEKISEPIIKETKEPTILFKGQVIKKGKVIILVKDRNDIIGIQK